MCAPITASGRNQQQQQAAHELRLKVYMDLEMGGEPIGRIVIRLRYDGKHLYAAPTSCSAPFWSRV